MRTVFIAAVFAFAFGLLTGCSSNSTSDTKNTVAPQDSAADKSTGGKVGKSRFPPPPPK